MQETTKVQAIHPPTSPSQGNDGGQGIGDFTFFGVGGGGGGASAAGDAGSFSCCYRFIRWRCWFSFNHFRLRCNLRWWRWRFRILFWLTPHLHNKKASGDGGAGGGGKGGADGAGGIGVGSDSNGVSGTTNLGGGGGGGGPSGGAGGSGVVIVKEPFVGSSVLGYESSL